MYIEFMSSKVCLLKKQIAQLQALLEVEMAKNANVSDGVHCLYVWERKNIVERTAPRAIRKPKVIGNINEIKANKVIKIPKVIGNIEEPKANRVIKIPKEVKVDDRHKRYLNPITLKYVLRPIYLAALRKIKKKDEEWHQKLKTFEEVSQKVEKKINDQQSWFPLKPLSKIIQNHLESKSLIKTNQ